MSLLPNSNAIETGGYTIQRSLRFRAASSAYLNRTNVASPTNNSKWTLSFWIKRGSDIGSGTYRELFGAYNGNASIYTYCYFDLTDHFFLSYSNVGIAVLSNNVFRDPAAWYHIVVQWDTTPNQIRAYVNGVEMSYAVQAGAGTYISSYNYASTSQTLMAQYNGAGDWVDGYLAEVNFIDGQALNPTYFGETSTTTGAWIPKKYTGTYGNNGSYLPFSDTTSATTLCYDKSGKGNNWTPHNISTTAGWTYDSMTDVPTLTSATAANYCVLNPLDTQHLSGTIVNGNLNAQGANGSTNTYGRGTMAMTSGKYYAEFSFDVVTAAYASVGLVPAYDTATNGAIWSASTSLCYIANGNKRVLGTNSAYGASWVANDIIGVAVDVSTSTVTFYKNGVSQGAITSTSFFAQGACLFALASDDVGSPKGYANFGQRPFSYTPPTGYVALNTFNLPTPTVKQGNLYMDATLYTGNGGTKTVTNTQGFQPGWVWTKSYTNSSQAHLLTDVIRGSGNSLYAQLSNSQSTRGCTLNSNGFSYVYPNEGGDGNYPGYGYVAYQWKAGSSTVSNTAGSITSQVSANTTAGFSVVGWTGTGVAGTVGHGLGVAPAMTIIKSYNASQYWIIWHQSMASYASDLYFNTTDPVQTDGQYTALPSSTVLSLAAGKSVNVSTYTYVAYCFAEITGYSKFGTYTGNGSMSDGSFVYTGFRPRWILIKALSGATYWEMFDVARNTYNVVDALLKVNTADAQLSSYPFIDVVSNGFKLRSAYGYQNDSGVSYIYAAFAENPFNYSNAR